MSSVSMVRPIFAAAACSTDAAAADRDRPPRPRADGSSASTSAPALAAGLGEQAVLAVEHLGQREVVAGLEPSGPVPIEAQKQVAAGSKQLTATRKAPSRRAA